MARFEHCGDEAGIEKAMESHIQAVSLAWEGVNDMLNLLANIGSSCLSRFRVLAAPEDLDRSIDCFAEALQLAPEEHPNIHEVVRSLDLAHLVRFKTCAKQNDIDLAIQYRTYAMSPILKHHRATLALD
ncbi:hypothetical protein FRC11_009387 [Ceratobasidium sp. 423]|nr:hypothetical protein FRC11_009387 [Ceratobasidium sp. 423]